MSINVAFTYATFLTARESFNFDLATSERQLTLSVFSSATPFGSLIIIFPQNSENECIQNTVTGRVIFRFLELKQASFGAFLVLLLQLN